MIKKLLSKYNSGDMMNSVAFMFCNVFQKGIAFVTVPIFTHIMTTSEYGQFNVFQSWIQILLVITSLNIAYGVLNKALTIYKESDEYVSVSQSLYTIVTLIIFVLIFILRWVGFDFLHLPLKIELLIALELVVSPALAIYSVKSRFFQKIKVTIVLTLLLSVLNPLVGLLMVYHSSEKGIARIESYLIVEIIICGIVYVYQFAKGKRIFNKEMWKYTLKFSLPLIPFYLSSIVLNQSDKIMIDNLCGTDYAGIYGLAFTVAMLMKIVNESINAALVPALYKKIKNNSLGNFKKVVTISVILVVVMNVLVMLLTPELIAFFGSDKYADAQTIMPLLSTSVSIMFMVSLFNNLEMYYEKNKIIMYYSIIISILNIILNYAFIMYFGYKAAAYTTIVCYLLLFILHCKYVSKHIKMQDKIFDLRAFSIIVVGMFCLSIIIPYTFSSLIIRIIVILIIMTIGIPFSITFWRKLNEK